MLKAFSFRGQTLGPSPKMIPFPTEIIKIAKGTKLQRTAPNICDYNTPNLTKLVRQDEDTGKTGNYFATYPFLSLAISSENEMNLQIAEFEVLEDLYIPQGKQSYRQIHPQRWETFPGPDLLPEENIDHLDNEILPLETLESDNVEYFFSEETFEFVKNQFHGELFLTVQSISKIRFVQAYQIDDYRKIKVVFDKAQHSPTSILTLDFWENQKVIRKISC